jgi:lipid-A-disaccharide synthase
MELVYHLNDFSVMGFSEVLPKLLFFLKAMKNLLKKVDLYNCKVAILIDFQEFNLLFAKLLKSRGVKVIYYVAPQAWAWRSYRSKYLIKRTDVLFSILPFEKEWFGNRGVKNILSVKHPLVKHYKNSIDPVQNLTKISKLRVIVLPGSRKDEVRRLLPVFMDTIIKLRKNVNISVTCCVVKSSTVNNYHFEKYEYLFDNVFTEKDLDSVLMDKSFPTICYAASGTITLATALCKVPTIVCYKVSLLNEIIVESAIKYKGFIALCNLILGEEIQPELKQDQVRVFNIYNITNKWLTDVSQYEKINEGYSRLRNKLEFEDKDVALVIGQYFNNVI